MRTPLYDNVQYLGLEIVVKWLKLKIIQQMAQFLTNRDKPETNVEKLSFYNPAQY